MLLLGQFLHRQHRSYLYVVVALVALCISIGVTGAQQVEKWALRNEAHATGMDWTHHIEHQIAQIATPDDNYEGISDTRVLSALLNSVIAVGNIYQIDYINAHCFCELSVGSYRESTAISVVHNHDQPAARIRHLLSSGTAHAQIPSQTSPDQLPIDRDTVRYMIENNVHEIEILHGDGDFQPTTYGVVYHPVIIEGGPAYLLRVLVNLEIQAANFNRVIVIAMILTGFIVFCLVGYPTWRYAHLTKKQQEADKRAAFLASRDVLTELHNRNHFQVHLRETLDKCAKTGSGALLYLFDLNGLKKINDYLGHHAGDTILKAFANLLIRSAPPGAYVARLGSDEFVVLIETAQDESAEVAAKLKISKALSVWINEAQQTATVSITGGFAHYPRHARAVDTLMQAVDFAHMHAKADGVGQVCAYSNDMKAAFRDRQDLRDSFMKALTNGDVRPHYQPIVNLQTGAVEGFEALARWYQQDGTILTPFSFANVMQDDDIGAMLGQVMFNQIANDIVRWTENGVQFVSVGLNVVDADLNDPFFATDILDGLNERGIHPSRLAIEVTENCLFHEGTNHFVDHLQRLRDAGCMVALDDFGTGYSSISQLKNLPFTAIKIDKSYVTDILTSPTDQAIISALQYLGNAMNFKVIVEGIETLDQSVLFQKSEFDMAQGYHFARPMPAADVPAFLAEFHNKQASLAG